jgi:ParB family chromosome partitioning protein
VTAPHGRPLGGLGRGLGALIPTAPPVDRPVDEPVDPVDDGGASLRHGARFAELPLDAIRPNPSQPRVAFDEEALAELVTSIREVGLLQPVVVRPVGPGQYELVMGERRWRASQEAGTATIPAIVRETADADMLRDALLENLHRSRSTRWRRLPPTRSCSRTSEPPTRSWPRASAARGRRSPTRSACCSCRRPCSAGWLPAC